MTIKTPPLSPKRDINIMSPSPLRISDNTSSSPEKANTMQEPIGDASSNKENDHGNTNDQPSDATVKEEQTEDGPDPMMDVQSLFEMLILKDIEQGNLEAGEESAYKTWLDFKFLRDMRRSIILAKENDTLQPETEIKTEEDGKKKGDTKEKEQGPERETEETASGSRYVSPSDALMSPCTLQLHALKGKRIARASGAAIKTPVYKGRIVKKDEERKGIEKDEKRDGDETKNGNRDGEGK